MFTLDGLFARRSPFILSLAPADDTGTGGDGGKGDGDGKGDGKSGDTFDYPADTPWKDMTPEQQSEYWREKAQKHEKENKRLKGGDWTPARIQALVDENSSLKKNGKPESDKDVEAAREAGRNEVLAELHQERASRALEKALEGRTAPLTALVGLDMSRFVVGGKVDDDAIDAWVEKNTEEAAKPGKPNPDTGQGRRGTAGDGKKTVASGRDLFTERNKKKTTTSTS